MRNRVVGSPNVSNVMVEVLNESIRRQVESGGPAISVDTKKKELVGDFKNEGRELRAKQDPEDRVGVVNAAPVAGAVGVRRTIAAHAIRAARRTAAR